MENPLEDIQLPYTVEDLVKTLDKVYPNQDNMCMGSNKPSVYTRPDPNIKFVDGNIKDPKPEPIVTTSTENTNSNNNNNNNDKPIVQSDLSIPIMGITEYSTLV